MVALLRLSGVFVKHARNARDANATQELFMLCVHDSFTTASPRERLALRGNRHEDDDQE